MRPALHALLVCCVVMLTGCGYNSIQSASDEVQAAWVDVIVQYRHRDDIVPTLMVALAPYLPAQGELTRRVRDAHAQTSALGPIAPPADATSLQRFQDAQGELSSALNALLGAADPHPLHDTDQTLATLREQLDDAQNRITGAQARYIRAVSGYNNRIRRFPQNLTARYMGKEPLPNFSFRYEMHEAIVLPPRMDMLPTNGPMRTGPAAAPQASAS